MPFVLQDWTGHTEVDPSGVLTVTANRIDYDALLRNADTYVYKDRGATGSIWSSHYRMRVSFKDTPLLGTENGAVGIFLLGNDLDDMGAQSNGYMRARLDALTNNLQLREYDNITLDEDNFAYTENTQYWLDIQRNGTVTTMRIYSDSSYSTQIDLLTVDTGSTIYYRYDFFAISANNGTVADISGEIHDFELWQGLIKKIFKGINRGIARGIN
jgi:hypothetical protein